MALNAREVMGQYSSRAYWKHIFHVHVLSHPIICTNSLVKLPCVAPLARHIVIAIPVFVSTSLIIDKVLLFELLFCRALVV